MAETGPKTTQSLDDLIAKKAVEFADQLKAAAAMADKRIDGTKGVLKIFIEELFEGGFIRLGPVRHEPRFGRPATHQGQK